MGFADKSLDHAHAGKVLLQNGVKIGEALLHFSEQGHSPAGEEAKETEGYGNDDHHDERQAPVDAEQEDQGAAHHQDGREEHD